MNKLIDKLIIFILSLFAILWMQTGNAIPIMIYLTVTLSSVNYYLLKDVRQGRSFRPQGVGEWAAVVLEIVAVIVTIVYPKSFAIIPIVAYDIVLSRNYIAGGLTIISMITFAQNYISEQEGAFTIFLYILVITILSVIISIRTERWTIDSISFRRLRDDSKEQSDRLKAQNSELLSAKDIEVYNAQLTERNRIAREIHDNVGHMLSRALLQMGALLAVHKEEPLHTQLEGVRETLDTAMNNIRSSVHDLHEDAIDVPSNVAEMAAPLREKYDVSLDIDLPSDVPRDVKYALIGISKECISNIIKHSANTNVDIRITAHPSMYQLVIHDYTPDGKSAGGSMLKKQEFDHGIGLDNIESRVKSVGGTLNISDEDGWRVFVSIPVKN